MQAQANTDFAKQLLNLLLMTINMNKADVQRGPQVFLQQVNMTQSYFLWALKVKCSTRLLFNYTRCHGFFKWQKFDHLENTSLAFLYFLEQEKKLPLAMVDNLRRFANVNGGFYPHWPCLHESQQQFTKVMFLLFTRTNQVIYNHAHLRIVEIKSFEHA